MILVESWAPLGYDPCSPHNILVFFLFFMWGRQWTPSKWGTKSTSMIYHIAWIGQSPSICQNTLGPSNVGLHFAQRGHPASDIQINVLEFIKLDPNSPDTLVWRESKEKFWMHRLKTIWHKCHRWLQPRSKSSQQIPLGSPKRSPDIVCFVYFWQI